MKIEEGMNLYLQHLRFEKGLTDISIEDYSEDFKIFLNYFSDIKTTDDLSEDLLSEFAFEQSVEGLKTTSINRRIIAIRNLFKFLETEGIKKGLIGDPIVLPKKEKYLPVVLTQDEIISLLNAPDLEKPAGIEEKAILEVLYSSGLRVSELVGLTFNQVNEQENLITVIGKAYGNPFNNRSWQLLAFSTPLFLCISFDQLLIDVGSYHGYAFLFQISRFIIDVPL